MRVSLYDLCQNILSLDAKGVSTEFIGGILF